MSYPRMPGFGNTGQSAGSFPTTTSPPLQPASGCASPRPGSAQGLYPLSPMAPGASSGAGFAPGPPGYGSQPLLSSTGPPPGYGQPSAGGYGMPPPGGMAWQPNTNAGFTGQNFPNATASGTYPPFQGQATNPWQPWSGSGSSSPQPGTGILPGANPSSTLNPGPGVFAGGAANFGQPGLLSSAGNSFSERRNSPVYGQAGARPYKTPPTNSPGYPGAVPQGPTSAGTNQPSYGPGSNTEYSLSLYSSQPGLSSAGGGAAVYPPSAAASSASPYPSAGTSMPSAGPNVPARRTSSTLSPADRELLEAIKQFDAAIMKPSGGGKK